jgi:predicted GIY-YIG superfamily endonuclease
MTGGYIYRIDFPDGKHYIGQTQNIEKRAKEHKTCANSGNTRYLYNALRKHNMVDTLQLIVIDTADTLEELCEKEIRYIKDYNSYYMNNGYNMTYGGEGANGYIYTEEDNIKNSERTKRYYKEHPDAGKEHSEKLKKRYKEHPEARERMSEISIEYWKNSDAREQQSKILKKHHEEHPELRQQMSERTKKYYEDNPEAKVKMSETLKNSFSTPEKKQKLSNGQKERFKNPDERRKNSERRKLHFKENPDAREKILDGRGKNKPFDVCTLDGTFIKTFTYQFEAIEYLKKEHHITTTIKISEVLKGRRKMSAGFVFKYK